MLKPEVNMIVYNNGLIFALKKILLNIQDSHSIKIYFKYDENFQLINNIMAINLFCIVTEALDNIVKHSRAKEIFVELKESNEKIILKIKDNGTGFDLKRHESGIGLINMNDRARLIHANLKVQTGKNKGTVITCCISRNKESF
jgi:signal transduction histidine kinase